MHSRTVLAAALALPALTAGADTWQFAIDQESSSTTRDITVDVPFSGTMIGNYDAETNPGGTLTRPGLFGGSGNQPVDYAAGFAVGGTNQSIPSGGFVLETEPNSGQATITGFDLDILGGVAETLDATLNINYESFRSFNPDSFFPGGFDIPVPIGAIDVLSMRAVQSGDAVLALGPGGALAGAIPVDLTIQLVIMGQDLGDVVLPSLLPVTSTLVVDGDSASLSTVINIDFAQAIPAPDAPFEDMPIDLPTVLPPGGVASLLISGLLAEGAVAGNFELTLAALGQGSGCADDPDVNGDGRVDGADLSVVLADWGLSETPADINCDGVVDGSDLSMVLAGWDV